MDILEILEQLRAQAAEQDDAVLQRIIDRYLAIVKRLDGRVDSLRQFMEANKDNLSPSFVKNSRQLKALLDEFEDEMGDFSAWLATELKAEVTRNGEAGAIAGISLLAAVLGVNTSDVASPSDDVLATLNRYLENGSPLMEKIRGMAGFYSGRVRELIIEGVSLGKNPLTIAGEIVEGGFGIALSDAMRWTRTLQNYSYRWSTLASYEANGIEGWIWWAELDDKVCASCVSLHGKVFPISEGVANDHHNGRCAMIPYIPGATDGFANPTAGKEWFDSLPEQSQREIMGAGKFEAYQDGTFEFDALSTTYDDDVFGTMRRETSLKELV